MTLTKESLQDILSHFPGDVTQPMIEYANNVALLESRYLFTQRSASGQQYGYCTHCRKTSKTTGVVHNDSIKCPACKSICIVKASGRGRKYLKDRAYFVWYEKSVKDPTILTAIGFYVRRDYAESYHDVETHFSVTALYVFEPGRSRMIQRQPYHALGWTERKSIISESNSSMQNVDCYCSHDSIAAAVNGTHLQYCAWEQCLNGDMLKFFELANKYPCVEYLVKLGLIQLVRDKMNGNKTFNAVRWNGKTIQQVLRVSKQDVKEIQETGTDATPLALHLFQCAKKERSSLSFEESKQLSRIVGEYAYDNLKAVRPYASLRKILRYVTKQYEHKNHGKSGKHYLNPQTVLSDWGDYLRDCSELEMDMTDEAVVFPSNLHAAHLQSMRSVKMKKDEEVNQKIATLQRKLKSYWYESGDLLIRPAASSLELFDEGKALNHCVGRYADRYAKGEIAILFIRRKSEPDKPFYTVELQLKTKQITQCRGLRNCKMTPEVDAFINAFTAERLTKKRRKVGVAV